MALIAALALVGAGCGGADESDLAALRSFDRHQLLWLGERFEQWELEHVEVANDAYALLIYGDCEVEDPDGMLGPEGGSCSPPLQLQVQPLCRNLDVVARAPIWKRRQVRGAPVGAIDSAPVLFTNRVQVKVYRGQGTDPGVTMRALEALRSVNSVPPVIDLGEPIPGPAPGVLERGSC